MSKLRVLKSVLAGGASMLAAIGAANAASFDIPGGDLRAALQEYSSKTGIELLYLDAQLVGVHTKGAQGDLTADIALTRILSGTGFVEHRHAGGAVAVVPAPKTAPRPHAQDNVLRLADAAPAHAAAGVETVVVTSSKIKGDIQTVPIAITALSQEQLTSRQIAGGPDLVKEVPNLTFTKTNFSGYSIQIRGIGTQAISVTTDPAVAVALNDIPFIRNHFFEQEFFDVGQVEVVRGPQGTLYGRNATAGVVNVISAKPTDQFEAMLSADWGNYSNRRYEGMVNIPIVDDRLDLRVAGEWTKRDGYTTNENTGQPVDGRDLWSTRVTIGWKPGSKVQTYLVWEHFQENDDRMRTQKQLCKTASTPANILDWNGNPVSITDTISPAGYQPKVYLSQGCLPTSLYSSDAFEVPNGVSLPYYEPLSNKGAPVWTPGTGATVDPYANTVQSRNLRVIEVALKPRYRAKNDTVEFNADYNVTPSLTFTSQTGYNQDFLWSTEDYNRFNTAEGAFEYTTPTGAGFATPNGTGILTPDPNGEGRCVATVGGGSECVNVAPGAACTPTAAAYNDTSGHLCRPDGVFCDPQLGCHDKLVLQDLNDEKAWQLSQEFRLASNFKGPFNFSVGGNYLHYETEENYYVFVNSLSMAAYTWTDGTSGTPIQFQPYNPGPNPGVVPSLSDNFNCVAGGFSTASPNTPKDIGVGEVANCIYIDPNPISSLNNKGHNYFLSQNPYVLNSYAGFGEAYYKITPDLKFTGGLRWTDDEKHFTLIPSELLVPGYGYPITGVVDKVWHDWTGRAAADWTPKLDFTDQTLIYGSYARGYKAGGANPPGAFLLAFGENNLVSPIHPLTFKPEFVDAYELGSKNTLADGAITLNGDVFFYNYKGYQISRIVDRTAINDNFDATVRGAELEAMWQPIPGLKFNFAGGYERTRVDNSQSSVDLMDRADVANHPGWMVVKPFVSLASNCILPDYVVAALYLRNKNNIDQLSLADACSEAYVLHHDPVTEVAYQQSPSVDWAGDPLNMPGYPGFDPLSVDPNAPANVNNGLGLLPQINGKENGGVGFAKDLSGNELPNAPHFTVSLSGDYTIPVSENWAATLHSDFYWQSQSWARIFNDRPYDKLRGYSNVNLALILTSASGWQVMGYLKNVFDTTQITGDFLNSDDSGLTTNVFLTDPRLFGVRVTKNW